MEKLLGGLKIFFVSGGGGARAWRGRVWAWSVIIGGSIDPPDPPMAAPLCWIVGYQMIVFRLWYFWIWDHASLSR